MFPDFLPEGVDPAFLWPVKFCTYITTAVYVASVATGNCSHVDRLWSVLPVVYTAYFALLSSWPTIAKPEEYPLFSPFVPQGVDITVRNGANPRAMLMLGLQVVWMFRLTYNAWRRGLLDPREEDYRWEILRQRIPGWLYQVFNLVFIAVIQNIILFMLGLPAYQTALLPPSQRGLTTADYVLAALSLLDVGLEFVADNQMFAFQTFKHEGKPDPHSAWPGSVIAWTKADAKRGFVTRGLWAWSRHPNFACEQSFWILQGLFPFVASGAAQKVLAGDYAPLLMLFPQFALCALFVGSTNFTEELSAAKYPAAYAAYQRRVSVFFPFVTPVWGWILDLRGEKAKLDKLVYGEGDAKAE